MNVNPNSDDHGKKKLCPKCNSAYETHNDALCQQGKQPLVDLIKPTEAFQTNQPYEQTKKPAESLQDTNTLLFATLPIENVNQSESAKAKQTTRSIWEKNALFSGASIGNYHRLEFVAIWRFGTIYSAEHVLLGNTVRLFVMDTTNEESLPFKSWFLETAAALAKIDHQHIDEYILDYGQIDGKAYVCISESTHTEINYLAEYANSPCLDEPKEGMSMVLSKLVRGLASLHSLGLVHGSINQRHIRKGKSPEAAVFCPLATGFPGENLVDQSGKISQNIPACKRQDFRDLIVAFIHELQGDNPKPIPKNVSKKWLHKQFPTISPNLADLLIKLFWIGYSAKAIEEILTQLEKTTNSPLRKITWKERSYGVATDALTLTLYSFPITFATLVVIGDMKTEYRMIPVYIAFSIISIPLIIWEPIFNSTIGKKGEYFLLDSEGKIPSRRRRLARSTIRLSTWFFFSTVILGILFSIDALRPTNEYEGLTSHPLMFKFGYFSFLLGIAMVYAMSIFFRGETFHDWITKTFWVTYRSKMKTNVLKHHISDVLGLKNKPARNIYHQENGSSIAEVNDIVVGDIIGRGGMGIVYQGWDKKVKRPIAIKLISNTNENTDEAIQRFRREAEIGSNLSHPNVAKVYSVGYLENHPYILLEYVDGETLNEIVKRHGPIQPVLAWQIIRQVAKALQATANLGIVHRDIKPSNIMLTRDGIVKVMDFGVSSIAHTSTTIEKGSTIESGKHLDPPFQDQTQLTRTGIALGTPQYMSPEQIKGERVDFRSDIYSLGLTLYTLLSGKPAFEGGMQEIYRKQCNENPPLLNLPELGPHQHRVLEKMLAKNKEERYRNYQDILVDLDQTEPEEANFPDGRDRGIALFIDVYICVVVLSYIDVVFRPAGLVDSLYDGRWSAFLLSALPAFVVKVALCGFYFGLSHWRHGSTFGQRLFRLKVLPKNGYKLHRRNILWRGAILASAIYLAYLFFSSITLDFLNRDLDRPFLPRLVVHVLFVTVFAFFVFLIPLATVVIYSAAAHYSRNDFRTPLDRLTGTRVVKKPRRNMSLGSIFSFFFRPKK